MVVSRPTDLHKVFIQTMLSRRVVRDEIGLELYKRAVSAVKCTFRSSTSTFLTYLINEAQILFRKEKACSDGSVEDENFRPTHPQDSAGFSSFMNEISDLLGEFGMHMVHGREETRAGKWFWALVCYSFLSTYDFVY